MGKDAKSTSLWVEHTFRKKNTSDYVKNRTDGSSVISEMILAKLHIVFLHLKRLHLMRGTL